MYLKDKGFSKTAYVVGEDGLAKELNQAGISTRGCRVLIVKSSPRTFE